MVARLHIVYKNGSLYMQKNHADIHKYVGAPVNFQKNVWYHVAVTWGNKGMRIYLDGILIASNNDQSEYNLDNTPPSQRSLQVGLKEGGGMEPLGLWGPLYFEGYIDEVRISNIERY
jgi:hypothetical protein